VRHLENNLANLEVILTFGTPLWLDEMQAPTLCTGTDAGATGDSETSAVYPPLVRSDVSYRAARSPTGGYSCG
jgi:hypothetical protein